MRSERYCACQTVSVSLVRVVTWNVHGSARPKRDALATVIRSFAPDVVALQEIRMGQAHRLASRLGWNVVWTRKHYPLGPLVWWKAEGHAVLSPHRLRQRHTWLLTPGMRQSTFRRRIAQHVEVDTNPRTGALLRIEVVNAHLASGPDATAARLEQAKRLATHMGADTDRSLPIVVLGDLNTHDEPEVLDALLAHGLRDAWPEATERSTQSGCTSPSADPAQRIDFVLFGRTWTCRKVHVPTADAGWPAMSDHLPVVADLVHTGP